MSSDTSVKLGISETPAIEKEPKPVKEKKPPTEKQVAQRQMALKKMQEKRQQLSEERKEKKEKVKIAKKVVEEKILKEDLAFATRNDLDSLRKELAELRALHSVAQQKAAHAPAPAPKERIVERIIEKEAPSRSTTPQRLTGHALLDKLFFEK